MRRRALTVTLVVGTIVGCGFASAATAPSIATHRGSFVNVGTHTGVGTATVRRSGTVRTLHLSKSFQTDMRIIRIHLYLANDKQATKFVDLGRMKRSGAQTFRIPARVKIADYPFVFAWCVPADVPITRAKLVRLS